jgi:hypothetical protein
MCVVGDPNIIINTVPITGSRVRALGNGVDLFRNAMDSKRRNPPRADSDSPSQTPRFCITKAVIEPANSSHARVGRRKKLAAGIFLAPQSLIKKLTTAKITKQEKTCFLLSLHNVKRISGNKTYHCSSTDKLHV